MNRFKKIIALLIPLLILTSCFKKDKIDDQAQKEIINVEKKPVSSKIDVKTSSFAASIILDDLAKKDTNDYTVDIVKDYSSIESLDFDVAVIPAYELVNLYNKTDHSIKLAAITLLNDLYIIGDRQVNGPADLKNSTIMMPNMNESMNKMIESKLGLAKTFLKVNVETYPSQKEVLNNLKQMDKAFAFLSEPYYSKAIEEKNYYLYDLRQILSFLPNSNIESSGDYLSEVIVVNNNFLKDNKENFDNFLKQFKESQENINQSTVISKNIIDNYDITNSDAIDIYKKMENVFITSDTMKGVFQLYIDRLEGLDKNIFSGNRPSDDIYYLN